MRLADSIKLFKQRAYDRVVAPIVAVYVHLSVEEKPTYMIVVWDYTDTQVVVSLKQQMLRLFEGDNVTIKVCLESQFSQSYEMFKIYPEVN